ncbi:unnamed protein product [Lathyrus sativus]|nr:unnamed protein product [Lathyrus sativus]
MILCQQATIKHYIGDTREKIEQNYLSKFVRRIFSGDVNMRNPEEEDQKTQFQVSMQWIPECPNLRDSVVVA